MLSNFGIQITKFAYIPTMWLSFMVIDQKSLEISWRPLVNVTAVQHLMPILDYKCRKMALAPKPLNKSR